MMQNSAASISQIEDFQDRALSIGTGGAMADDLAEEMFDVAPNDSGDMKQRRRRVWDKKKQKFVFEDQIVGQQVCVCVCVYIYIYIYGCVWCQ